MTRRYLHCVINPKDSLYMVLVLFLPVAVVELVGTILYFGPRNGTYGALLGPFDPLIVVIGRK